MTTCLAVRFSLTIAQPLPKNEATTPWFNPFAGRATSPGLVLSCINMRVVLKSYLYVAITLVLGGLGLTSCQTNRGAQVVFGSFRDGNWEVYLLATAGATPVNLTRHDDVDQDPDLSPDGKQILFTSNRDDNDEIYRMERDGNNVTRLTNHPAWDRQPRWSPDGQMVAFVSDRDENQELYLMDWQGKQLQRLTQNPAPDYAPRWSPDGRSLAFISERDGQPEVYRVEMDSKTQQRLTHAPHWKGAPVWSPQGDQLAVLMEVNAQRQPYVLPATGGELTLQAVPGQTLDITWSTGHEWLIAQQDKARTGLWRVKLPDLVLEPLFPDSQWDRQPDSSP